jgi:hypothetical protein
MTSLRGESRGREMAESSTSKQVIYSFVARGSTVLVEYTSFAGNFSQLAVEALEKSKGAEDRFTYTCDGYTFNFLNRGSFSAPPPRVQRVVPVREVKNHPLP